MQLPSKGAIDLEYGTFLRARQRVYIPLAHIIFYYLAKSYTISQLPYDILIEALESAEMIGQNAMGSMYGTIRSAKVQTVTEQPATVQPTKVQSVECEFTVSGRYTASDPCTVHIVKPKVSINMDGYSKRTQRHHGENKSCNR